MAIIKGITFSGDRKGWRFWCPGCEMNHGVAVEGSSQPIWTWNGSTIAPTFGPSIRVRLGNDRTCHLYVVDGELRFLSDCYHALAGKIVPMVDLTGYD